MASPPLAVCIAALCGYIGPNMATTNEPQFRRAALRPSRDASFSPSGRPLAVHCASRVLQPGWRLETGDWRLERRGRNQRMLFSQRPLVGSFGVSSPQVVIVATISPRTGVLASLLPQCPEHWCRDDGVDTSQIPINGLGDAIVDGLSSIAALRNATPCTPYTKPPLVLYCPAPDGATVSSLGPGAVPARWLERLVQSRADQMT
ncbi:hypothetical protein V8C35DRAFT_66210 [Trichoderma chlorosporum]